MRPRPGPAGSIRTVLLAWVAAGLGAGCASARGGAPLPILEGAWELSTTVQGVDHVGLLTFAPDGLVIWDGAFGERNVCEARPLPAGGGYTVGCPLRLDLVPNDEGELVTSVAEVTYREGNYRRCLRREERSARMVCVEWETTPREERVVTRRPIVLTPTQGATVRWPATPGGG